MEDIDVTNYIIDYSEKRVYERKKWNSPFDFENEKHIS